MRQPRALARNVLDVVDEIYRRRHRLRPVGPMLYVARARYRGPHRQFADGTRLAPGDTYGELHFDNSRIAALGEGSRSRTGVRIGRLLRDSFATLAEASSADPGLRDLDSFHGVTWLREHGGRVGFVSEPLPDGLRRRLLALHFRLLRWVFAPSLHTGVRDTPAPRSFWLTRNELLANFRRDSA